MTALFETIEKETIQSLSFPKPDVLNCREEIQQRFSD